MPTILVLDDERPIRSTLREILEYEGYTVEEAEDGDAGLHKLLDGGYDAVLCDIKMPKKDGMEVLEASAALATCPPFIMISGHGTIDTAMEAVRMGAYDFLEKPPDLNRLLVSVRNALERDTLVKETKTLRKQINRAHEMVGKSAALTAIRDTIAKAAPTDARVLITGANGSGKELVARQLHAESQRSDGPFIEVNCAAIPAELIESELFGHEKGAFTGALKQRIGKFEQADGGTLFLDEIGDMSLSAQAKVLRALQEHKITRVGGDKEIKVNVRVVAATNKNLLEEIEANAFREDLYHRLGVILVHVPPLRERLDDIPLLAERFLDSLLKEYGMPAKTLSAGAIAELQLLPWTGNVRELRNVMERLVIFGGSEITAQDVQAHAVGRRPEAGGATLASGAGSGPQVGQYEKLTEYRDAAERAFLLEKLLANNWNISKTAEQVDIQRSHLYNKIEKYGLKDEKPS